MAQIKHMMGEIERLRAALARGGQAVTPNEAYLLAIYDAAVAINRFQDILGWQPGESRNKLVCEIRDRVLGLEAPPNTTTSPLEDAEP